MYQTETFDCNKTFKHFDVTSEHSGKLSKEKGV